MDFWTNIHRIRTKVKRWTYERAKNRCENDPALKLVVEVDEHYIRTKYVVPDQYKGDDRYWGDDIYANGNIYAFDNCSPIKINKGTGAWRSRMDYATFMRQRVIRDMYNAGERKIDWMLIGAAAVGLFIFVGAYIFWVS